MIRALVLSLTTAAFLASPSYAAASPQEDLEKGGEAQAGHRASGGGHGRREPGRRRAFSIPEFDPATAGVIGVIVAGGGLLVARRRKR